MARNWRRIFGVGWQGTQIQMERVTQLYIWTFVGVVVGTLIAISLGVLLNQAGIKGGNFVLAAIFLLVWAFFTFWPGFIALVFGIGSVNGLPKDWSLNELINKLKSGELSLPNLNLAGVVEQGLCLVQKMARWSAHIALFVTTVFVVLGSWDIENPGVIVPVIVVLAGIGLLSVLFPSKKKWYRKTVTGILFISLAGLLYTGYHYFHPQDETVNEVDVALRKNEDNKMDRAVQSVLQKIRRDEILTKDEEKILDKARQERRARSLKGAVSGFFYKKTLEVEVSSITPQKLCGIQQGTRTFHIPRTAWIVLDGDSYNLTSAVLVNWTQAGESFEVADTGCVTVSFNFNERAEGRTIPTATLPLVFH